MIERGATLPVTRQVEILGLSRSSIYYEAAPVSDLDLALMRRIDEIHLERPFMGARMLRLTLRRAGYTVGRRRVGTLMRRMGIEALYRKPNTSKKHPEHQVFPYLLRNVVIDRPNQVWAADITYIPMRRGFVYLFAIIDWATRKVLAWSVSISLTSDFCIAAVEAALAEYGCPDIFNTDQGSQFTSNAFVDVFGAIATQLSMDGRGCWRDNVFVERLWRSIKYEEVYLHAYETVAEARSGIAGYIDFYNRERPHSSLDKQTPDEAYYQQPALQAA
jgi:putative transposase